MIEIRYRKAEKKGHSHAGKKILVDGVGTGMWKAVPTYEDSAVRLANGQWVVAQYRFLIFTIKEARNDTSQYPSYALHDITKGPQWSDWFDVLLPVGVK